jgi:hypothetical protein
VRTRRGRALASLGRRGEAREEFQAALSLDPTDAEARRGLASTEAPPRNELRVALDYDFFNFSREAQAATASLRSDLGAHWSTLVTGNFQQRFGEETGRFAGAATCRLTHRDALTVGGSAARDRGVIARREAFFEYGRGIRLAPRGPLRGLELAYRQQWYWFRDARILALTPGLLLYLPREWTWSLHVTAARSRFPTAPAVEWQPSGITRLSFPLRRRLTGSVFYAVGAENFARADQVGRFSARTWGGGARWHFAERQDLAFYALYQDRSQARRQVSFGWSYGIRF